MKTYFINIRACNGAGKTSLLRRYAARVGITDVIDGFQPVYPEGHPKAGKNRGKPVPITRLNDGVVIVGDYSPASYGSTTAGLDRISTQADAKAAILYASQGVPQPKAVLFEGIIVSTIFQGWLDFSKTLEEPMIWAFVETPVETCLTRIAARNGGKEINEDLVWDKWRSIRRVKEKAVAAGEHVWVIDNSQREKDADLEFRTLLGETTQ